MPISFLISILLGLIPEVLFITGMTTYLEDIKTKRGYLFLLNSIGYIVLIMLCRFELLFYVLYVIYLYLVLKLLYKVHISCFFMISAVFSYIILSSFLCSLLPSYILGYILSRIALLLAYMLFRKRLRVFYNSYRKYWNRHTNNKIKSLTLRNCSLIFVNTFILILAMCIFILCQ